MGFLRDINRCVYERREVVRHYARVSRLQCAESSIFKSLGSKLDGAHILDLGVGGGRTTTHLAPRAKRYVGLDYSEPMIDAARKRFTGAPYEFVVGDARDLAYEPASFDLVLFSHNGIDYVGHDDRLRVLSEVRRVLRPRGVFIFSTHNLGRTDLDFSCGRSQGFWRWLRYARHRRKLRAANPHHAEVPNLQHTMLDDGAFGFELSTYHIRMPSQIAQVESAGFDDVAVYSSRSGDPIGLPLCGGTEPSDPWLYFTCRSR